ncbi:hypothetical protein HID58_055846, partial [Brassica napus]
NMFTLSTSSTVVETMSTLLLHNFHFAPHNSLNYKISPLPRRLSFTNARLCIKNNQISCNSLRMDSSANISAFAQQQRIEIPNSHNEKLVGLLHETGSKEIVILCHGFRSSKDNQIMKNVAAALEKEGISAFRFDFSGNGESEGSFYYGNYNYEADDLRSLIQHFSDLNRVVPIILGHSKGGDVVLLYASKYHDISNVINLSGRYDLKKGIRERLGEDFLEKIKEQGFIDVNSGRSVYRVTEESLMERLNTDMHEACLKIDKDCRVLTVHGSDDEVITVEDAKEFAKIIPNHKLEIVEGADHRYTGHQSQLVSIVMEFIKTGTSACAEEQQRIEILNSHNEKLVGLLHETGSTEVVVLCHGFRSNKNDTVMKSVAAAIEKEGISAFRFDFSGNGESEGSFYFGNYNHEADDLRSVIQHFSNFNRVVPLILGHSKGGDVVLLYASKYHDISNVINLSGRYDLKKGIGERLGEHFLERLKQQGFFDVKDGTSVYRVTEESILERLNTDMHEACLKIDKDCRVLTVHGSEDEIIPVEDAREFAKIIPNHKLEIVEGADHCYTKHQSQLVTIVMEFIKTVTVKNN